MKKISFFITVLCATLLLGACQKTSVPEGAVPAKTGIKVVTTFYPLYDFTSKVVGNLATVENMTPAGVEPHDFEPSPRDLETLYSADLIVMNGAGLDAWVENNEKELISRGVKVLKMSEQLPLLTGGEKSEYDPHFWLDPVFAQKETEVIRDALIELLPAKRAQLLRQAGAWIQKLKALDSSYKNAFIDCLHSEAVVSHNAFGYIGARYGIDFLPIAGLSPEEEPSARTLATLAGIMKEKGLKIVFFETLSTPKLAETLSREVGATILKLNPLEGLTSEEITAKKDYLSVMQDNLKNLKTALECR
jgi:zinc transport system substrate-binding protein